MLASNQNKRDTMKKIFTTIMLIIPANVFAKEFLLDCDRGPERYYLVAPDKSQVKLVGSHEAAICDLKTMPHMYTWTCPKTEKRSAFQSKINRYSAIIYTELGDSPFDQKASDNLHFFGSCKKLSADPKF